MTFDDLKTWYATAEEGNSRLFAEQRHNILLQTGKHYVNGSQFNEHIRNSDIEPQKKIRVTKNHTHSICRSYINNILKHSPSVGIYPANDDEIQDQKAAELARAVYADLKQKHKFSKLDRQLCMDFIVQGECVLKVFWDRFAGQYLGEQEELDENNNVVSSSSVFTGDIIFERILSFNLLTAKGAKGWDDCKLVAIRKQVPVKDLRKRYAEDEEKLKYINASTDETFIVFDATTGVYSDSKDDETCIREYYHRPCLEYPNGYFWITTSSGVLEEGELPYGIFPVIYCGFDEISTSARCASVIRQIKPFQVELNRCASKVVLHSLVLGDDKILVPAGTKLSNEGFKEGVRKIVYTGEKPEFVPGRAAEQYLEYMGQIITEMYQIAGIQEDSIERNQAVDATAQLFQSLRDKKNVSFYSSKFEEFLIERAEIAIRLAKRYYTTDMLIPVIGKNEYVNIPEFRSTEDFRHQCKIESQTDDIDTVMGRSLQLNQILQYASQHLDKGSVGAIAREMPFLNKEPILDDLTIDYDNAKNDILALDRGEQVSVHQYDNHSYLIAKLINRTKRSDFRNLSQIVQQNYYAKIRQHEEMIARQQQEALMATSGYIPASGALISMYGIYDPQTGQRVKIPMDAAYWLIEKLKQQGQSQQQLAQNQMAVQADVGNIIHLQRQEQMGG